MRQHHCTCVTLSRAIQIWLARPFPLVCSSAPQGSYFPWILIKWSPGFLQTDFIFWNEVWLSSLWRGQNSLITSWRMFLCRLFLQSYQCFSTLTDVLITRNLFSSCTGIIVVKKVHRFNKFPRTNAVLCFCYFAQLHLISKGSLESIHLTPLWVQYLTIKANKAFAIKSQSNSKCVL